MFELHAANERAPKLAEKPHWWRAALEHLTSEHRELRAGDITERGRERSAEAEYVRDCIREGYRDELGSRVVDGRELPGGAPEVARIIWRWDRELAQRSNMRRRLVRAEWESADRWAERVLAECERRITSRWHVERADGQRKRFGRVASCATTSRGILTCTHCNAPALHRNGRPIQVKDLCGSTLLCQRCRLKRQRTYRAKFRDARDAMLSRVKRAGWAPGVARRDPLVERFLTLTCPHLELADGGPEAQARIVRAAWSKFINALRNHWRGHGGFDLTTYVRVLEATTGRDELGHIHIHAWLLSPFVRVQTIRALWGKALLAAGFPREAWPECAWKEKDEILDELDECGDVRAYRWAKHVLPKLSAWPRVDIERIDKYGDVDGDPKRELACELVKYLCKDVVEGGVPMHPQLFAAVYRGLDGGRLLTCSRGFWLRHRTACACCGALDSLCPVEAPDLAKARARAPPLAAWQYQNTESAA